MIGGGKGSKTARLPTWIGANLTECEGKCFIVSRHEDGGIGRRDKVEEADTHEMGGNASVHSISI